MPASLEPAFLKRVGALLTEADHKRRLDRLLFNDSRWTGERNERAAVIRRVIALLSEDEKKKAEARLAVFLRAKNSNQLLSKLPAHAQTDWGLAVQKAQALRRQKKEEEAWKILLAEPEASRPVKPDGWWEERRANAYAALQARQAQDGLRARAQSRRALRQRRQGRLLPRRLAGAAPPAATPSWRSATSRRWPRRPTAR